MIKKVISVRRFKVGYEIRTELIDGKEFGCEDFEMKSAYTLTGDYIGNSGEAYFLCKTKGIKPEKISPEHNVCSIGFSEKEQKWYGWSHRAIYGFGIGDVVKEGDSTSTSGWVEEYIKEHPEKDLSLPIGFEARTLDDAKCMAIAFADSVA